MNSAGPRLHVRMRGRSREEEHRVSSPLELLFDLTFVVAVSSLAAQLADSLLHGQVGAIIPYLMVFFAIWWAWMNFTWFASAYDTDDVPYRLFTLVQMAGVLVLAAGVPAAFAHSEFLAITLGYVIMRIGLVANWVRAAIEHPESRRTALRYAGGVSLIQLGWVLRLLLPVELGLVSFVVLALLDLSVPLWAERGVSTSWHPGHIAERYGLFVIILLGESVAAATVAMQRALSSGLTPALVVVGAAGLVLLFAIWWIYYLEPAERGLTERPQLSYFWGYGHWFLFAAIAAIGSGLEVAVDAAAHRPEIGAVAVGYALAVPISVLFVLLYVLHRPLVDRAEVPGFVLLPAAALELLAPLTAPSLGVPATVVEIALVAAGVVAVTIAVGQRRRSSASS
ncbi:MAG: low temperature requirement protein A [Actinomycetota bacterium]|nr:low temperature requirement protein A [Actinomycetota bacterium]